jgi:hypothetical protein
LSTVDRFWSVGGTERVDGTDTNSDNNGQCRNARTSQHKHNNNSSVSACKNAAAVAVRYGLETNESGLGGAIRCSIDNTKGGGEGLGCNLRLSHGDSDDDEVDLSDSWSNSSSSTKTVIALDSPRDERFAFSDEEEEAEGDFSNLNVHNNNMCPETRMTSEEVKGGNSEGDEEEGESDETIMVLRQIGSDVCGNERSASAELSEIVHTQEDKEGEENEKGEKKGGKKERGEMEERKRVKKRMGMEGEK